MFLAVFFFTDNFYILSISFLSFYVHLFKLVRRTILLFVVEHALHTFFASNKNLDPMQKEFYGCERDGGFVGRLVVLYIVQ